LLHNATIFGFKPSSKSHFNCNSYALSRTHLRQLLNLLLCEVPAWGYVKHIPTALLCCTFDVPTSCFHDFLVRKRRINRERIQQRSELRRLFKESWGSGLDVDDAGVEHQIGRFKIRNLMKEAGLTSKHPGTHRYKIAQSERPVISNLLAREFDAQNSN